MNEFALDQELVDALKTHLSGIKTKIVLAVGGASHPKYVELKSLLMQVAKCNEMLHVQEKTDLGFNRTQGLGFEIFRDDIPTGIAFAGLPGGHEFSSFILALLNAAGLGKLPDLFMQSKIKSLKGPINVRTFVSLSCENCPEVVQVLNQMALLHNDFTHEMIDGDLAGPEVARLKIGSVPAVFVQDEMLMSGKLDLGSILEKLSAHFGENMASQTDKTPDLNAMTPEPKHFDVLVVGGGPAGVAAAIYSARKGLKTGIVAERMGGQVRDTKGIENLISTVYTEGEILTQNMTKHLSEYPIEIMEYRRVEGFDFENQKLKSAKLNTGETLTFEKMIFATGAKWRELKVPGEKEYLGRGVAFCPHCDGPLYKGKSVAVVGGGNSGVEAALDLAGICKDVVVVEYSEELKADQVLIDKMKATSNIRFVLGAKTEEILGKDGMVVALKYQDRISNQSHLLDLSGVFVQIGLVPNSSSLKGLVDMNAFGEIQIDAKCRTNVSGVYAAGDVTTVPFKQIVVSLGEGAKAALAAYEDRMHG